MTWMMRFLGTEVTTWLSFFVFSLFLLRLGYYGILPLQRGPCFRLVQVSAYSVKVKG
jgi:hypothetical protein